MGSHVTVLYWTLRYLQSGCRSGLREEISEGCHKLVKAEGVVELIPPIAEAPHVGNTKGLFQSGDLQEGWKDMVLLEDPDKLCQVHPRVRGRFTNHIMVKSNSPVVRSLDCSEGGGPMQCTLLDIMLVEGPETLEPTLEGHVLCVFSTCCPSSRVRPRP